MNEDLVAVKLGNSCWENLVWSCYMISAHGNIIEGTIKIKCKEFVNNVGLRWLRGHEIDRVHGIKYVY